MKKSIAILSIITHMSIYKIIVVLLFMGISQVTFVYLKIKQCIAQGVLDNYVFEDYINIELLWVIFMISFLMINLVLYWTYHEKRKVHTAYLFERISIGRKQKFAINTLYALFCYFLLYGWQICISRILEWLIRSLTNQGGEPMYQYISGTYYADLMRGIYGSVLFFGLMSIEVAKSQWRNKPPIGFILVFVWYAATYINSSYSYRKGISLIISIIFDISICVLYFLISNRKLQKNEKNIEE